MSSSLDEARQEAAKRIFQSWVPSHHPDQGQTEEHQLHTPLTNN